MDVLIAEWPNGSLAASTFDMPTGYGEQFRASFEARGFTVTRMTANARRVQLEQGRRQMQAVREHPVSHPVTVSAEEVVVVSEGEGLPAVGQPVRHQVFGAGAVAYHLTMPTGPVAVGRGPGWEGLLSEGQWEVLGTPNPQEYSDLKTPKFEPSSLQAPSSELLEPPRPLPLLMQMPSLFGDL